ncbi:MAG: hypothetical protein NT105_17965 [Verrucomicrobia bacterium]|nr:hypothetical protein [Verrucomicrobiota bacterium]
MPQRFLLRVVIRRVESRDGVGVGARAGGGVGELLVADFAGRDDDAEEPPAVVGEAAAAAKAKPPSLGTVAKAETK